MPYNNLSLSLFECMLRNGFVLLIEMINCFPVMHDNCCLISDLMTYSICEHMMQTLWTQIRLLLKGAVWSGSIVFAFKIKVILNGFQNMQQTT